MDLFLAGVEDRPGVLYQCSCAEAPPPTAVKLALSLGGPWKALSSTIFTTLYGITSRYDERYPCASPDAGAAANDVLTRTFEKIPGARANDGVVPVLSQIWGEIAWAGYADHLDVLGHFAGTVEPRPFWAGRVRPDPHADARHVDWLRSGSGFDERAFGQLMDAIANGMLRAS
jgi:hypothetical protein